MRDGGQKKPRWEKVLIWKVLFCVAGGSGATLSFANEFVWLLVKKVMVTLRILKPFHKMNGETISHLYLFHLGSWWWGLCQRCSAHCSAWCWSPWLCLAHLYPWLFLLSQGLWSASGDSPSETVWPWWTGKSRKSIAGQWPNDIMQLHPTVSPKWTGSKCIEAKRPCVTQYQAAVLGTESITHGKTETQ